MPEDRQLPKAAHSRKISVARTSKAKANSPQQKNIGGPGTNSKGGEAGELIAKLRKPMAPPTRVAEDERKYSRARMRERSRHED
jgi:hypothetical protein